jgi:hypothetical protein
MHKPISTKMHGAIDLAAAAAMVTVPRALGWDPRLVGALHVLAGGTVAYSLLTNYEFGAVRVLPMKTHLGIDGAAALATAALPWLVGVRDTGAMAALAGFAAMETAVTLATERVSPLEQESAQGRVLNPS